jgi:DNA-directed RNA polymerase subunit RPC12/RpoP
MSKAPDHGQPPPLPQASEPTKRKFPCPQCGARLDFHPGDRALKCPYCNHVEEIPTSAAEVRELDFEHYLRTRGGESRIEGRSTQVRCPGCGAVVLLEDKVVTDHCPFCTTALTSTPESAEDMIPPESLLPFVIDRKQARAAFVEWLSGLWFAPNALRKVATLGQVNGVYLPFWTYDAMTFTFYQGQRGDDYQETETYTEQDAQGNTVTRTRTVTRTHWTYVSGEVQAFFDDILICASKSVPVHHIIRLPPWDLERLEGFQPAFLSGFKTERYAVDLRDGFEAAKVVMEMEIRRLCCQQIGGDHQRIDSMATQYAGVTFKHLLLPTWLASYRYFDRVFQVLVNGRTGKVAGDRPYSWVKILSLVLFILAVVGVIIYFWTRGQTHHRFGYGPHDAPAAVAVHRAGEENQPIGASAWAGWS